MKRSICLSLLILVQALCLDIKQIIDCQDDQFKCQQQIEDIFKVDLSNSFNTQQCQDRTSVDPYRVNMVEARQLLQEWKITRSIDISTFDATTNRDYPLLSKLDRIFTPSEMGDFEKIFDPKEIDYGTRSQFQRIVQKFHLQNTLQHYSIKINEIRTDSPHIDVKSNEIPQIIKSDRRTTFEVHFLPVEIKKFQANIYFLVDILSTKTDLKNHQKLNKVAQRTLVFKIKADIVLNDFRFQPVIQELGNNPGTRVYGLEMLNPHKHPVQIQEISSLQRNIQIRVPHQETDDRIDVSDMKYVINLNDSQVQEKNIWELPNKSMRRVAQMILKSNSSGIIRDTIRIQISNDEEYHIPFIVRILDNGLNFQDNFVDMGLLTQPNIISSNKLQQQYVKSDHEYIVSIYNTASHQIDIVDISFEVTPSFQCFKLQQLPQLSKRMLAPNEKSIKILKLNLYGSSDKEPRSYKAKLKIITTNTLTNLNTTSIMTFSFAEYADAIIYNPIDMSLYVNSLEYESQGQMQADFGQKVSSYTNTQGSEFMVIERDLYVKNNFSSPLTITKIYPLSSDLVIIDIKNKELPQSKRVLAFTIQFKKDISELKDYFLRTYLVLEFNDQFTVPISFIVFDKSLDCGVSDDIKQRCSSHGNHKLIDFQNIAMNEQKEKKLYVTNNNPSAIDLTLPNMEDSSDVNQIKVVLEDLFSPAGQVDKRQSFKQTTKRKIVIKLQPKQTAILSFILNAEEQKESSRYLILTTPFETIQIPVHYNILTGNMNILPWSLHFDQSFPGRASTQKIYLKSNFRVPFQVQSIESNDKRFVVRLLNTSIIPGIKTEIAEVQFDARRGNSIYVLDDQEKVDFTYNYVSYKDLQLWRQNTNTWNQMVDRSQTDVKAVITIKTEVMQNVQSTASVILIFPQIVKEQVIDFTVQNSFSKSAKTRITLFNPSDKPLKVQLFLGSANLTQPQYQESLIAEFKRKPTTTLLICIAKEQKSKLLQFMQELSFIFTNLEEFEMTWSGLDDYEMNSAGVREIKSSEQIRKILNQQCVTLLDTYQNCYCHSGTVPLKIQNHFEHYQIQTHMWDIANDSTSMSVMTEWMNSFKQLYQDFMEIEEVSLFSQSRGSPSRSELGLSPNLMDKLVNYLGKTNNYIPYYESGEIQKTQFALSPEVKSQQFIIDSHSNISLDVLVQRPGGTQNATLIIKNNLTVLQIVPIQTQRRQNQILLTNTDVNYSEGIFSQSVNEYYVIKIDEKEIYGQHPSDFRVSLKRLLFLHNMGNVPVQFNRPKFDNHECRSFLGVWVEDCKPFNLIDFQEIEVHINEYIKDLVKSDTINLNFYSQNYFIKFKLKFEFPPNYQHTVYGDPSQTMLSQILLFISLIFMFYNFYKIVKYQKIDKNLVILQLPDTTFASCHQNIHNSVLLQKSAELAVQSNFNDSSVLHQRKREKKDPPTESSDQVQSAHEIVISDLDQDKSPPLILSKLQKLKLPDKKKNQRKEIMVNELYVDDKEVIIIENLESFDTFLIQKTEEEEASLKMTTKQKNRIIKKDIKSKFLEERKNHIPVILPTSLMDELRPQETSRTRIFDSYQPYIDLHLHRESHHEQEQISFSESEIKSIREDGSLRFDQDSVIKENLGEIFTGEQEKIKFLEMYAKCDDELKKECEQSSNSFSSGQSLDENEKLNSSNNNSYSQGEIKTTPTPTKNNQFDLFAKVTGPPLIGVRLNSQSSQQSPSPIFNFLNLDMPSKDVWNKTDDIFFQNQVEDDEDENEEEDEDEDDRVWQQQQYVPYYQSRQRNWFMEELLFQQQQYHQQVFNDPRLKAPSRPDVFSEGFKLKDKDKSRAKEQQQQQQKF